MASRTSSILPPGGSPKSHDQKSAQAPASEPKAIDSLKRLPKASTPPPPPRFAAPPRPSPVQRAARKVLPAPPPRLYPSRSDVAVDRAATPAAKATLMGPAAEILKPAAPKATLMGPAAEILKPAVPKATLMGPAAWASSSSTPLSQRSGTAIPDRADSIDELEELDGAELELVEEPKSAPEDMAESDGIVIDELEEVSTNQLDNVAVSGLIDSASTAPSVKEPAVVVTLPAALPREDFESPLLSSSKPSRLWRVAPAAILLLGVAGAGYWLGQRHASAPDGEKPASAARVAEEDTPALSEPVVAPLVGKGSEALPALAEPEPATPEAAVAAEPATLEAAVAAEPVVAAAAEAAEPTAQPVAEPEPSLAPVRKARRARAPRRARQATATPSRSEAGASTGDPGILMLGAKPPCAIAIDGADTGLRTPQRKLVLAPGTHKVTLRNAEHNLDETFEVSIQSGQKTKVLKDLTANLP